MSLKTRLTGEEEEWLLRAATSPRGVIPPSVVAALVAAGLGDKNPRGALDVSDAGRQHREASATARVSESGALAMRRLWGCRCGEFRASETFSSSEALELSVRRSRTGLFASYFPP